MATTGTKNIASYAKQLALLPAVLFCVGTLRAQTPDTALISRATAQYKNENAVYTTYSERLVLDYVNGELTGNSYVKNERLLISEIAPQQDKYDFAEKNYFLRLTGLDFVAYTPTGKGKFKENHKYSVYSLPDKESAFYDDSRTIISFFTGLTKGSLIRSSYSREITDLSLLPSFIFEAGYPIMHADFEVSVPNYINIKFAIKGEHTNRIKQTSEEKNGRTIYHFTADNVPASKQFSKVPSRLYYLPHVIPYINSFRLPGDTKDSVMLSDAAHLYKLQYQYVGNRNIKQDTNLNNLVAQITAGDKTQKQKAAHLYQWVQKNMHYVAYEAGLEGWIPREADTVCKRKYGDCKDMSSLLVAMCRKAGIEAYFAWIGTTYKPYTFEETPLPIVSNHMICALKLDNDWTFIDGTHANLPFGVNRSDVQGKQAMIAIDAKNFKIVTLPLLPAESSSISDNTSIHISDKNEHNLAGIVKQKLIGYPAWNLGIKMQYMKEDDKEKEVKELTSRGSNKYVQTNYKVSEAEGEQKEITLSSEFTLDGQVSRAGKQAIINMNLSRTFGDDYIDTAGRSVSYYFPYKHKIKQVVTLDIPAGYKVTYLPKPASGGAANLWNYRISYTSDKNKVVLTKEYQLNTVAIAKQQFDTHNKMVEDLQKQYKESVVLTAK